MNTTVKTINIAGIEYPVKYGVNALNELCKKWNVSFNDFGSLMENFTLEQMLDVVYVGLKFGAKRAGKEFTLTPETIGDLVDDHFNKVVEFVQLFGSSLSVEENALPQGGGE